MKISKIYVKVNEYIYCCLNTVLPNEYYSNYLKISATLKNETTYVADICITYVALCKNSTKTDCAGIAGIV